VAALVGVGLALSGCGIIGNPAADKERPATASSGAASASPSPTGPSVPEAGQCHANDVYTEQISMSEDRVVLCEETHMAETVHVGRFVGDPAAGSVPLLVEGATGAAATAQRDAYADCGSHADQYLGHSWIHPLLTLRIGLPDNAAWQAGERWYRCDLYQLDWVDSGLLERKGSLKTSWLGPTCFDTNKKLTPLLNCSVRHPSEYAGGFMLPTTLTKEPKTDKELGPLYDKCAKVVAAYIGVSTTKAKSLVGQWLWWQYDDTFWASGRRAAWCFTWTGAKTSSYVTGSAQGRKGQGL
jgi:hypothetical protein